MKAKEFKALKAGDKVLMKPARKDSTIGYALVGGKVVTIREVLPQYAWACAFEEVRDPLQIFRCKDIEKVVARA